MSFRKYGGLDRAATNNIVRSNYATGNNESITVALGQENSKIICKSHLDLSGNSLINVGSIYFMEEAHLYGNLIMDGTVTILETTTLYGPLIVNNTSYFAGNSTFNSNVTINGALNLDGGILTSSAATFLFLPYSSTTIEYGGDTTTNIIMGTEQSTAPDNGALVVIGGVGIGKNLNIGGDTLIGGSLGVSGSLGVTGPVHFYDTLTVEGDATFNSSVGISGPLGVTGPVHFYDTLTVEGVATFNSSVGISGPLGVTGPVHFYNTLTVDGDAIFNSSVGVSGPLGVTGPTNLYNTLTVGGTAIFNGPVGISGPLDITGALNVGGTATFGNSIVLSGPTGSIIMNGPTGNYIQFPDQTKQYTAGVPAGTIVMWSGASNDVPQYWTICNGNAVTGLITGTQYTTIPNLQNYFILGAGGSYQVGNIGGTGSVSLSTNNLPAHSHDITAISGTFVNSIEFQALYYDQGTVPPQTSTVNFQYGTSTYNGPTGTNQSTGGGQAFENLPPYYSLYYIMFTP